MLIPSTQIQEGPSSHKSGQYRTRRPFFVAKVEAFVHIVDLLGIERYNAINKWKTLVHTTKISPQQRKGKAVLQMLLDRVLVVDAFLSQHPTKLRGRHKSRSISMLIP